MKILLDIDGVMIPARPWRAYEISSDGFGMFSKSSVDCLNDIIKSSLNPEIILTTSHKNRYGIDDWKNIFSNRGIIKTKISRLNTESLEISRIEEIRSWYLKNQNESFIVIDDDKGLNDLDTNFKEDYLVLTKPTIGLDKISAEEAVRKIEHLQKMINH